MQQCPLMKFTCCCLTSKILFTGLGLLCLGFGVLTAFWPSRSIVLYQRFMERFNWKVTPIDEAREVRNTARLGFLLVLLSLGILVVSILKF